MQVLVKLLIYILAISIFASSAGNLTSEENSHEIDYENLVREDLPYLLDQIPYNNSKFYRAIYALSKLVEVPGVIDDLIDLAENGVTQDDRIHAMSAMKYAASDPRIAATLISLLEDPDLIIQYSAILTLEHAEPTLELETALLKILRDDADSNTVDAAELLTIFEPNPEILDTFLAGLFSENYWTQRGCSYGLANMDFNPDVVVPALINAFESDVQLIRFHAANALISFGPLALDAVPVLIEALINEDASWELDFSYSIRGAYIKALIAIDPSSEEVVRVITNHINHEFGNVQRAAIKGLGSLGPYAIEALPDLHALADNDEDEILCLAARVAIAQIEEDYEEIVSDISFLLTGEFFRGSIFALRDLGRLGDNATGALPVLYDLTNDPAYWFVACEVIGEIEGQEAMIQQYINLLEHGDPDIRGTLIWFLGNLGPDAFNAIPIISEIVEDEEENEDIRDSAWFAIKQIEGFGFY